MYGNILPRLPLRMRLVFLYKNNKWLNVSPQELYNFTVWVAQSPAAVKDETVLAIEKFLRTYLTGLSR